MNDYYLKRLRNYLKLIGSTSVSTWTTYKNNLNLILEKFPEPEKADLLQIQDFALTFTNDDTRKNICVMIRWLFNKCLSMDIKYWELPYPRKVKKVQPVYENEDIIKVMKSITNYKQQAILALMIDTGVRCSEPCSILISDCNSKNRSIVLRKTKFNKQRTIYPSEYVWSLIKKYWNGEKVKPVKYLFEGQVKGTPYTTSSIRQFLERGCFKAGVKYLGTHAIRRHTITWSVENDIDLTVIANNVGHENILTIQKSYLYHNPAYLRKIKTPLTNYAM